MSVTAINWNRLSALFYRVERSSVTTHTHNMCSLIILVKVDRSSGSTKSSSCTGGGDSCQSSLRGNAIIWVESHTEDHAVEKSGFSLYKFTDRTKSARLKSTCLKRGCSSVGSYCKWLLSLAFATRTNRCDFKRKLYVVRHLSTKWKHDFSWERSDSGGRNQEPQVFYLKTFIVDDAFYLYSILLLYLLFGRALYTI